MFSTLLPQLERELLWRASGNEKNKFMKFWWSSEPGGGIGKVASKSFLLTLFFRDLTDSHWQIFHSLWKMGLELSRVNLGFISKSQLSNICRADWVKGLTSSPGWTLFKTSWCVGAGAESVDSVVRITGKEEEEFNPILPLIFSRGPCRQLFLEGLRFVVFLTSAVSYHPLPGKRTQAHCCCWTTQQTGARDAKYQLTFACCGLLGLVSPPALFFFFFFPPARCCLETDSCISLVQRGKFLAAKLSLAIWSAGQQSPGQLPGTGSLRCGDFPLRVFCCLFKC